MLETEQQYTIENPYQISEAWKCYDFGWGDGNQVFAIYKYGHPVYAFRSGAGVPLETLSEEHCEMVASYLSDMGETVRFESFATVLTSALEASWIQIRCSVFEGVKDYLKDRAIADPRAKQLLQELEA